MLLKSIIRLQQAHPLLDRFSPPPQHSSHQSSEVITKRKICNQIKLEFNINEQIKYIFWLLTIKSGKINNPHQQNLNNHTADEGLLIKC